MRVLLPLLLVLLQLPLGAELLTPQPERNSQVIYEVNLRQYTPEGNIEAFREHLPRLRELGVDILWFMPVQPIGEKERKGSLGSPYSIQDYRDVNPEFGTLDDFKSLVAACHELGFTVLLDWVANHCAWDNPVLKQHPDWFTRNEDGDMVPPVPDWSDVVDFDYESRELWEWMTENMLFWLREADIDGFRCDVAGMVPLDFWRYAVPELQEEKAVFMLAEWAAPELHESFHMSYNWDLHHVMNDVAQGKSGAGAIRKQLEAEGAAYPAGSIRMLFTSNHDENSWNGTVRERLGASADLFSVVSFTLPGMPLIYSGQEAGLDHRLSFFEKDEIEWKDHYRTAFFRELCELKHTHPALATGCVADGGFTVLETVYEDDQALVYLRQGLGRKLLVAANLSGQPRVLHLRDRRIDEDWKALGSSSILNQEGKLVLALPAWGWTLLDAEILR